jgi:copper(I)-binding protein
MKTFLTLALWLGLAPFAIAQTSTPATIEIAHAWARATAASAPTAAAYLTIINRGATDDRLTGVATPVAERAEPHITLMDSGVMKMRPIAVIEVKAGQQVELKPGAMHIMLVGLKAPLKEGAKVPLTLTFAKAGTVEATAVVMKAGATAGHVMPGMTE